jgi:hypothetical protein
LKIVLKSALVAFAMFSAQASQALVVFTNATIGRRVEVTYEGRVSSGNTQVAAPALSALTIYKLTSISSDQKKWTFEYTIKNTSTVTAALRAVGFNADASSSSGADIAIKGVTATGNFNNYIPDGQFPVAFGRVDLCLSTSKNCTGGNTHDGVPSMSVATGIVILEFANAPARLTLDKFVTRFQAISPSIFGQNSGIAIENTIKIVNADGTLAPVPEPAQWTLLIGGFGLTGAAVRRRKAALAA